MSAGAALLFPGQGAQAVGMGRAACERSRAARAFFARADEALGYALSTLCFEGPEDDLRQTRRQQPAILVCSLALLAAHDECDGPYTVACATGHSLGLYTALAAAGALDFDEALRLVARRADLMQRAADARAGGMAAVLGLADAEVAEECAAASQGDDVVVPANYNAPGQIVISGARDALERATALLKARGARKVVPLAVAGAFHSPLMRAAADEMAAALRAATIRDPAYPIIANGHPRALCSADEVRAELAGQILAPVRWVEAMRHVIAGGAAPLVDCGPGTVLAGLLKRIVAVSHQPSAISPVAIIRLDE